MFKDKNKIILSFLSEAVSFAPTYHVVTNKLTNLLSQNSAIVGLTVKKLVEAILSCVKKNKGLPNIEFCVKKCFPEEVKRDLINKLSGRTDIIFNQIRNFIEGASLLDLGSGSGLIGKKIKDIMGLEVLMADMIDYNNTALPLLKYNGLYLPLEDKSYDNVLLITVLHHSLDPYCLLRESKRVGKRLIIIETIYDDKNSSRDDLLLTAFFDWFYNRIIAGREIDMPCNFKTAAAWENIFRSLNFNIIHSKYLGEDINNLFLKHHLFVLS